ncbi:Calcineurin B -like proteinous protein 1like [Caligus rogercresseyi]|uniref:Calcineurin B -like proteinous protein 1like n=1 Tax=Caligus rogercresseyi TaxID=217165 RepID=A0A7T8KC28_CALRO|nr:Calcineurin B -like proteinous protein 1like [Caligus rogercresseyi]
MGGNCSNCHSSLDNDILEYLTRVKSLWTRFQNLDTDKKGYLIPEDLLNIPKFRVNPLAERLIITIFYMDTQVESLNQTANLEEVRITFPHFVESFAWFNGDNDQPQMRTNKAQFLFNIFDIEGTGKIKIRQIYELLEVISDSNVTPASSMWSMSQEILLDMKQTKDEKTYITFDEFYKSLDLQRINTGMQINF